MDNDNILQEITERLNNHSLKTLSLTPFWNSIKKFSEDQLWWYHRTEFLVGRSLIPRRGDWRRAYNSLEKNGLQFSLLQDYGSPIVVSVLLEIGIDPTQDSKKIMTGACGYLNLEVFKILLEDRRVDPSAAHDKAIIIACENGRADILELLLRDGRADPSLQSNALIVEVAGNGYPEVVRLLLSDRRVNPPVGALSSAVEIGDTEIVQLLLADGRVDPSIDHKIIRDAVKYDLTDIVRLLISDERVLSVIDLSPLLEEAVVHNYSEMVRLLLEVDADYNHEVQYYYIFNLACRYSSLEIVILLLDTGFIEELASENNRFLRRARRYKRNDIEALLLRYPEVREYDEAGS